MRRHMWNLFDGQGVSGRQVRRAGELRGSPLPNRRELSHVPGGLPLFDGTELHEWRVLHAERLRWVVRNVRCGIHLRWDELQGAVRRWPLPRGGG